MSGFKVISDFDPTGDQPNAIEKIANNLEAVSYTHLRAHET